MSTDNFGALGADFFIKTFSKGSTMSQADLDALVQYVQLTTTIIAIGDFTPNEQDSVWMILERVDVPSAPGYTVTNNTDVTMTSGGMITIDSIPWTKVTGKPALFTANQTLNTGDSVSFNRLTVTGASGAGLGGADEGGEIQLAKAPNSTLAGDVIIDVYQNKLRFFESGGNSRGFYLDLTTGANNTNTNIMSGGSSFDGNYNSLTNKPALFSGAYADLTGKPAAQILQAPQWNALHNLGTGNRYLVGDLVYDNGTIYQAILTNESQYTAVGDATYWRNLGSGIRLQTDYLDLANKPTIPTSFSSLVNDVHTVSLGADGALTLPIGVSIDYYGNSEYPRIIADSGKRFSVQGQGNSGSAALAWTTDPNAATQNAAVSVSRAGGDNLAKVVLQAQSDSGNVATAKTWKFDETGILTLPSGGTITEGGGFTGAIKLTPTGGANEYQSLVIYPTGTVDGDHVHLTAGGGTTELYLGNDSHYVKLVNGGNVEIKATTPNDSADASWIFGTDGRLSLGDAYGVIYANQGTGMITIGDSIGPNGAPTAPGTVVNIGGADNAFQISAYGSPSVNWTFDRDGDLTAPRNIILNNPVTTVTETETGTIADSNANPFTFRILKSANPQLVIPFADPNFVLKWTAGDAGSLAAAAQAPGGHGVSSLVSDDGTYWNFNSWYGLGGNRPNTGTVFTVEYGVVVNDTTISTTETNLVIEADAKQWTFGTDGDLTLPASGDIVDSTGAKAFVSLATLKQVVAASTDFADFQTRIAGMQ